MTDRRHRSATRALCSLAVSWALASPSGAGAADATSTGTAASPRGPVIADGFALRVGGQYRVTPNASNFPYHADTIGSSPGSLSFVNQRLRTWLNIHERDRARYGAYLQVEIGHTPWGSGGEFPKTHLAAGDNVGIELRRGYLWLKPSDASLLRVGVVDWQDRFGERSRFEEPQWSVDRYDSFRSVLANSIWDFNVGGVDYEWGLGSEDWHGRASALVLDDGDDTLSGSGSALLFGGDLDRDLGESQLGASLYYIRDRGGFSYGTFGGPRAEYRSSWDLWAGVRGHFVRDQFEPSFFLIVSRGQTTDPDWEHTGWAGRVMIEHRSALGKLTLQALYASGDDATTAGSSHEFRTIGQSERDDLGAMGYWSLLGLTSPRGPSDINDLGIGLQNRGLGLVTLQAGLERVLSDRASLYLAAGWLRSAEDRPASGSADIGIEVLAELSWQLVGQLHLNLGASVLDTGAYFRASPTDEVPGVLYETYLRMQLEL